MHGDMKKNSQKIEKKKIWKRLKNNKNKKEKKGRKKNLKDGKKDRNGERKGISMKN